MDNFNPSFSKIGDILVHQKIISQQQLENALSENSRSIAFPHGDNTDVVYSDDIKFDIEQLRAKLGGE